MDQDQSSNQCHVPARRQSSRQTKPPVYLEDYVSELPSVRPPQSSHSVASVQSSMGANAESHSEFHNPILQEMKE